MYHKQKTRVNMQNARCVGTIMAGKRKFGVKMSLLEMELTLVVCELVLAPVLHPQVHSR